MITANSGAWARVRARLFAPVDVASLVIFRIAFGAIMFWEVWRYFEQGRIPRYFLEPSILFTYYGFDWVRPWPGDGLYWHFALIGALSLMIMVGLFYRLATILLLPAFAYVFLLDATRYLNHFYLIILLCLLLIFLPANRALSVDAWRRPARRSDLVPAWTIWLLRAQLGIVYLYAAFAKMNADWFAEQPTRIFLESNAGRTLLGVIPVAPLLAQDWFVAAYTWGGLLFDLLIVPALLWRRTRAAAFLVCVGFHLANAWAFHIGVFPWLAIAATTIFFEPDWPRRVKLLFAPLTQREVYRPPLEPSTWRAGLIVGLLGVYLTAQLLIPFRHLLYPGSVHWTEEGHRFSWHMKLRVKDGSGALFVRDPATGEEAIVDPREYLDDRRARKVLCSPDMLLQFAHSVADEWRANGHGQVEVRSLIRCSLNGRPPQLFVDPEVDLAAQRRTLGHVDWVLPLETELER